MFWFTGLPISRVKFFLFIFLFPNGETRKMAQNNRGNYSLQMRVMNVSYSSISTCPSLATRLIGSSGFVALVCFLLPVSNWEILKR